MVLLCISLSPAPAHCLRNNPENREALLRTGTGTQSFSLFAMDVKAEGDFDDVWACHRALRVYGDSILSADL